MSGEFSLQNTLQAYENTCLRNSDAYFGCLYFCHLHGRVDIHMIKWVDVLVSLTFAMVLAHLPFFIRSTCTTSYEYDNHKIYF